jgi:hypothetical protein
MASKAAVDPMKMLVASAVWVLVCALFGDQNWHKLAHLRSAGQDVSQWRYAEVAMWMVALLFWIWNGWKSWRRYHADKG